MWAILDITLDIYCSKPCLETVAERVFIGKSPVNEMTSFSGGHGPKFDGNSILIQNHRLTYIEIGREIFEFEALDEIVTYVSPVGNSDVPYPYAVDSKNRYYLMIANVILNHVPEEHVNDPYDYYYKMQEITQCSHNDENTVGILGFRNIREFRINDDVYLLTYHPFAAKDFKRLTNDKQWSKNGTKQVQLKITTTDGQTSILDESTYVELMESYGKLIQVTVFESKLIVKRV